jgi:glycine/D-amino acid oxidase-like deaminating enzyme
MVDYLIVGSGLAGIAFAETALRNNKTILVINDDSQNSSKVAAGLYNPVILKRFSEVFQGKYQMDLLDVFYKNIEDKLLISCDIKMPIYRKFFSVEEQNNWFAASDKPNLAPFLSTKVISKKYQGIESPFGYGEVLHTGYVDTTVLLNNYNSYLVSQNLYLKATFEYSEIVFHEDFVQYKAISAKHIVFAEGFGLHANPFFNYLPLDGTKGELLIIKAPQLNLDVIVNTSVFILPLGNDLFKVGATYNWEDKTSTPTEEGKQELVDRIKEILTCDFEIISHFAGVRPTVKDRKPMIGTHKNHDRLHILNGLGTRGVMLAPAMAKDLFDYIESSKPLDRSINIVRFDKKK